MLNFRTYLKEQSLYRGLQIPREQMPQIEDTEEFVGWLRSRGYEVDLYNVKPEDIITTQKDFDRAKVDSLVSADWDSIPRFIVSEDYHILDGHHRFLALKQIHSLLECYRVQTSILNLVNLAREFLGQE